MRNNTQICEPIAREREPCAAAHDRIIRAWREGVDRLADGVAHGEVPVKRA